MRGDAIDEKSWQTLVSVAESFSPFRLPAGVLAVGDPAATRTVYATVVVLAVLGVALLALSLWILRRTRPEPELLAPLEAMNTRGWRNLDPAAQRRRLDESRPAGAVPLRREASVPNVDDAFAVIAPVESFDDLTEDADASRTASDAVESTRKVDTSIASLDDTDSIVDPEDLTVEAGRLPVSRVEQADADDVDPDESDHESDHQTDEVEAVEAESESESERPRIDPLLGRD